MLGRPRTGAGVGRLMSLLLELHRKPAQNSQREGRSLPREGRGPLFQWDVGISVGSRRLQVPYIIPRPGVPRHIRVRGVEKQNLCKIVYFLHMFTPVIPRPGVPRHMYWYLR